MVNGIGTIYHSGLNKGFGLKFRIGSQIRYKTPKETQRTHRSKHCEYNDEDEDNSSDTLNDKNYQTSSQKFRQII